MIIGRASTPQEKQEQAGDKSGVAMAVERLIASSTFKRSDPGAPNTEFRTGRQRFYIETINRGDHPDIPQVQDILLNEFDAYEVDSEEILRQAVEGRTPWGLADETKYRIHVVKDIEGKVLSAVGGGLLDLRNDKDQPTGKMVYMVGYAVTLSNARQTGLAREAYISAIMDAVRTAERQGKVLAFAAGECTSASENFWNTLGWKRAYAADHPGEIKLYTELQYIQPALDFSSNTGELAEGAGEKPAHLMIESFGPLPACKEEIMQTVRAFYRWCNRWPREAFSNDEAYQRHFNYILKIESTFRQQLERSGQLICLDKEARDKVLREGVTIREQITQPRATPFGGGED